MAVTFLDTQPEGIEKFSGTEPAGCSFWRLAAAGRAFYTVPADHFNCAVGAYTHNVRLPPERVAAKKTTRAKSNNLRNLCPYTFAEIDSPLQQYQILRRRTPGGKGKHGLGDSNPCYRRERVLCSGSARVG